jgi:hypothetical protein
VSSDDAPQGENLDERARSLNSNLQRLIEAVGGLLSASGELLGRLQQVLTGVAAPNPPPEDEPPPPTDRPVD